MRRKILFGVDYTDSELIKLLLYLFVGGTAALVEWALFYIFFHYLLTGLSLTLLTMLATALSFCLATLYHYFLGNVLVFDSGSTISQKKRIGLAPSMRAASISSSGSDIKNWRNRNVAVAEAISGNVRPL